MIQDGDERVDEVRHTFAKFLFTLAWIDFGIGGWLRHARLFQVVPKLQSGTMSPIHKIDKWRETDTIIEFDGV